MFLLALPTPSASKRVLSLVHMPHDIISQHANKNMASDPVIGLVVNWMYFETDSFHVSESLLDLHQAFVVFDGFDCSHDLW